MDLSDLMSKAKDSITVERAFGEPIERDGVLVIPVAVAMGGGGGGGDANGGGGGFGGTVRPVGVYIVRGGEVRFEPSIDVTALTIASIGGACLILRTILGGRRRRSRKHG